MTDYTQLFTEETPDDLQDYGGGLKGPVMTEDDDFLQDDGDCQELDFN